MAYTAYVNAFCKGLRSLMKKVSTRFPGDVTVARTHKRVMFVTEADPLSTIRLVGPYLLSYQDQIDKLNDDYESVMTFFVESSFDDELREAVDKERTDLVMYLMPLVKQAVQTAPVAEKKSYANLVCDLLYNYIEYLAAERGI